MARLSRLAGSATRRLWPNGAWPILLALGGLGFALAVGLVLLPWLRHLRQLNRGLPVSPGALDAATLSWIITLVLSLALAAAALSRPKRRR